MIKTLSAIALAACAATVLALLTPEVEASVPRPLPKADRLDIRPIGHNCSQQTWPNFEAACLHSAGSRAAVREARLVTANRMP